MSDNQDRLPEDRGAGSHGKTDLQVQKEETETKGRYFLTIDGETAELTYSRAGTSKIILDHTDVPDGLRGKGIGDILVARAVDEARHTGLKIIPLCPFAKSRFQKHPDYRDVLA